jgi:small subunit ribosomal protein S16
VGTYNPNVDPPEISVDLEKIEAWQAKGANLSETVASLVRKARTPDA